jgi:alanine racemase
MVVESLARLAGAFESGDYLSFPPGLGVSVMTFAAATLPVPSVEDGPLLVVDSSQINGSVFNDVIVKRNCDLRVRGNIKGSLTIEPGASVVVEGSVDGKVVNKGGRLVVNNRGVAEFARIEGPPEAEAGGILKIDLTAIVSNWELLAKRTDAECAAVVKADAYGCGIDPVTATLKEVGCKTFFVSNLPEAKRVRLAAPNAVIYILNGFYADTGPVFAEIGARPVINNLIEMAAWDAFAAGSNWAGGFAVNVDTGAGRLGLTLDEAAGIAQRVRSSNHGVKLLMSRLENAAQPDHPLNHRQISHFLELRRLYTDVPASLAECDSIFLGQRTHYDLVRAGPALYGANPTPKPENPMLPVIELQARIVNVCNCLPGQTLSEAGWTAQRPTRIALAAVGYADGFARTAGLEHNLRAIVGGRPCRVVGRPAMDLLAIDVTGLSDQRNARQGEMVTLIGGQITIDNLASDTNSTAGEVLCNLGRRFHRVYYAS